MNREEVVIDAEGLVAGRLASYTAKLLLRGKRVIIVNAEKAIITGNKPAIIRHFRWKFTELKTYYNPEKRGPKIPRRPDLLVKRMVRGMLPYKKPRGRQALARLRVYIGVPRGIRLEGALKPREAFPKNPNVRKLLLADVYREFGGSL